MKIFSILLLLFQVLNTEARFLEDEVYRLDGTSSHIDGPNCWNGALYIKGIVPHLRFIHPDEWLLEIKKNCEKTSTPIRGDLGRIYHEQNGEVHGFIHLSSETVFAKHGESSQHGYEIMSYEKMMDQYGKARDCRISGSNDPSCFHKIEYYRCHGSQEHKPLSKVFGLLSDISFSEETRWSFKATCDESAFLKREQLLKEILGLENDIEVEELAPELWSASYESLRTQLYNIEVSNRNFRCKPRSLKSKTTKEVRKMLDRLNARVNSL